MSARQRVAEYLSDLFKTDEELAQIDIVATEREIDEIRKVTIQLRLTSIGRLRQAPLSYKAVEMVAIVISPHDDIDMAADQLDEVVPLILDALHTSFWYEDAELVHYGNRLAFRIPLTVIANKE